MADVFVSYARPDRSLVEELGRRLEGLGLSVFYDTKVAPGDNWESRIEEEYRNARMVVVLWSDNAAASEWVKTETQLAVRAWSGDRLFLVRLDGAPLPTGLGGLQAVEAATASGSISADDWDAIVTAFQQKSSLPPSPETDRTAPGAHEIPLPGAPVPESSAPRKSRRTWIAALAASVLLLIAGTMVWLSMPDESPNRGGPLGTPVPSLDISETRVALVIGAIGLLISLFVLIRWRSRISRQPEIGTRHAEAKSDQANRIPMEAASEQGDIDLFVSYSRADVRSIDPLIEHIRKHGLNIWIDTQRQDGDVRYAGQIVRAIRACRSVLIMCSENAYRSDHVVREVYVSGDHKKPFIVVQLDDVDFPDDFQYFLSGFPRIRLEEVAPEQFADKVTALIPA